MSRVTQASTTNFGFQFFAPCASNCCLSKWITGIGASLRRARSLISLSRSLIEFLALTEFELNLICVISLSRETQPSPRRLDQPSPTALLYGPWSFRSSSTTALP